MDRRVYGEMRKNIQPGAKGEKASAPAPGASTQPQPPEQGNWALVTK